ncbi:hypothetical protein MY10362_002869 [Beauveria mimosiformis]
MASHGRLDVLVNNAGIVVRGEARAAARRIFQTNVIGYISVTEALLPPFAPGAQAATCFLVKQHGVPGPRLQPGKQQALCVARNRVQGSDGSAKHDYEPVLGAASERGQWQVFGSRSGSGPGGD